MKKMLSVIISLSMAMGIISSCSQKSASSDSEISVAYVSIPDESDSDISSDETKPDDESDESAHKSDNDKNDSDSDNEKNESQESSDISDKSDSQSENSSNPESLPPDLSSQANSNTQSQPDSHTSNPTVTTVPTSSGALTAKTTTTSKSNVQTTATSSNVTATVTSSTTALKPTVTTHATALTLSDTDTKYPENATVINLSSPASCNDPNVSATADKVSITAGGTYYLSGNFNGQIYIKTGEGKSGEENIDLYLAGVDITCSYGPAIFCDNAKRFKIHLVENTANVVEDGGSDATNNGAVFSNDTIEIKGKGSLTVYGNNREGIASDDDIFIENGNIFIFATDDGINANDCITINGGYTYIEAGGDGIDSKGTTVMSEGTVIIAKTGADESAIESDSTYTLNGGTLIAVGGTGLIKGASNKSSQGIITFGIKDGHLEENQPISIKNSKGTLVTFMPVSSYSAFTFTCPELSKNDECEIYIRGSVVGGSYSFGVVTNAVVNGAQFLTKQTAQ